MNVNSWTAVNKGKKERILTISLFSYPKVVVRFKVGGAKGHTLIMALPLFFPRTFFDLLIQAGLYLV